MCIQFANVQLAFYPHGLSNYSVSDFLFQSDYQKQLENILGLLPSTGVFFPVGEYLFSRLFTSSKKEFVNTPTLNDRLRRLLHFKLIEHHLEREDTRKEWYSTTEKGKQVLNHLEAIRRLAED